MVIRFFVKITSLVTNGNYIFRTVTFVRYISEVFTMHVLINSQFFISLGLICRQPTQSTALKVIYYV